MHAENANKNEKFLNYSLLLQSYTQFRVALGNF